MDADRNPFAANVQDFDKILWDLDPRTGVIAGVTLAIVGVAATVAGTLFAAYHGKELKDN